jgi:arylsulfatase A-like enzyme
MSKLILLVCVAYSIALVSKASCRETAKRPNIILVMADDLGWSDIGCYGGEIETPNINSLAKQGLRFTQFYNNAICGPTRASLLTGLYCQQIGHRGDRWNEPKDYKKCVTISEVLQTAGYQTAMVGKWQGRDSALDRGFDRFYGPMCQAKISYFHEVQGNPFYLDRQRVQLPDDFYLTSEINDHALRFLNEGLTGKEPFFLYVAHIAPHWPLHAREADVARYRETYRSSGWDDIRLRRLRSQHQLGLIPAQSKLAPRPAGVRDWMSDPHKDWQAERMAVYAAQVAAIDRGVGQLLQTLNDAGEADNTLVMFLSDNGAAPDGGLAPSNSGFGFGPSRKNAAWRKDGNPIRPGSGPKNPPGPHDTFAAYGLAWANASNTPLRGTKLGAFEGGIRTPLVARWPAVIRGDTITRQPGHVIDFMATCLDAADVDYPTEFRGRQPLPLEGSSLLPIFRGQQRDPHEQLCWSVPQHDAIRVGKWKAVKPRQGGTWQLFDLDSDGSETTDLASRQGQRLQELTDRFKAWRERVGVE